MAKKPNEPFTQYIPVVNNSEMYKLGKALTNKDLFKLIPEQFEAIAQITDVKKDILIQVTQYDIMQNPSILMQATRKEEIVNKVNERLNNLDQDTGDMYKILFTHWMKNKVKDGLENEGKAFVEINEIHFGYRGLKGRNQESGITDIQYDNYMKAIDVLVNTKVQIDITKETNIVYDKIKSLKWGAIEGFLINNVRWVWNDAKTRTIGIWYDLGLIGEAYIQHIPQINNKYPTALLQLDYKVYATVKNIGNYLCYLHRCNENANNKTTVLNFYNLLGESRFEIKAPRIQEGLNRFVKNLNKAKEILIMNHIISDIEIPSDLNSKNYKNANIVIKWLYKQLS